MQTNQKTKNSNALLFLHAHTPLHPGSGTALGFVDLPVQRERHTQWPLIPGSALKGILRDVCREKAISHYEGDRRRANEEDQTLTAVFGPGKIDKSDSHAGALSITDARILAFPVRSLKGVFAWVTCPAVLERLSRDANLAGHSVPGLKTNLGPGEAACRQESPLLFPDGSLVFEEFEFKRKMSADQICDWISVTAVKDEQTGNRMKTHLAVIPDNDFTHFVRFATEVTARIGLDYNTKTVKQNALFYEEFLPSETIFYALVIGQETRKKEKKMSAEEVVSYLESNLPHFLQVGADETIGKGICACKLQTIGG